MIENNNTAGRNNKVSGDIRENRSRLEISEDMVFNDEVPEVHQVGTRTYPIHPCDEVLGGAVVKMKLNRLFS
jgi:hypothetical protein